MELVNAFGVGVLGAFENLTFMGGLVILLLGAIFWMALEPKSIWGPVLVMILGFVSFFGIVKYMPDIEYAGYSVDEIKTFIHIGGFLLIGVIAIALYAWRSQSGNDEVGIKW